jgi:hypothetical protein
MITTSLAVSPWIQRVIAPTSVLTRQQIPQPIATTEEVLRLANRAELENAEAKVAQLNDMVKRLMDALTASKPPAAPGPSVPDAPLSPLVRAVRRPQHARIGLLTEVPHD